MKYSLTKIYSLFKRNFHIFLLVVTISVSGITIQTYQYYKFQKKENFLKILNNIYFKKTLSHIFDSFDPRYTSIEHTVTPGETLAKILKSYKIPNVEINKINKELSKKKNNKKLKINQLIKFTIDKDNNNKKITKLIFPISKTKKIQLVRNEEKNIFESELIIKNLEKKIILKEGKITRSLYQSATRSKIPPGVIVEFAQIYGFQVDFQRDIRKNDLYEIVFETFHDEEGKVFETGKIIFANLILSGQENPLYFFIDSKKKEGHYDLGGKSVKKALMKTPINGARLSSSYGMRKLRKSFFILKDNIPIFISTADHFQYKKYKLIYSGLISCLDETNLFDILKAIKVQNNYLNKERKKYCFISIDRKNKVLMHHWKYFGYQPLNLKNKFYNIIKKFTNISDNHNIFYKKI